MLHAMLYGLMCYLKYFFKGAIRKPAIIDQSLGSLWCFESHRTVEVAAAVAEGPGGANSTTGIEI